LELYLDMTADLGLTWSSVQIAMKKKRNDSRYIAKETVVVLL